MAKTGLSPLYKQLARVHRRLLVQSLLNALMWFWAGAILLAAVWFLLQPLVLEHPPQWLRWVVAGGILGLGTVLAALCGALWAPSKLAAALSLDSEFGLKERVTTSLTLARASRMIGFSPASRRRCTSSGVIRRTTPGSKTRAVSSARSGAARPQASAAAMIARVVIEIMG